MKKELLLACGLMLALPGVQGFAAEKTDKLSAFQHQTTQMKALGMDDEIQSYYEVEPNDTMAKATNAKIDSVLAGENKNRNASNGKDVDYFKFDITEEDMAYSLIAETMLDTTSETLKVRVLSENGSEAAKSITEDFDGDIYQSIETELSPGTYYLEVTNSYSSEANVEYSLFHFTYSDGPFETTMERLWGDTRYDTAVEVSKNGWEYSDVAVIATGKGYADALSATPLAFRYDAPLLLTKPEGLPESVKEELNRLEVQEVFLIGGTSAISDNVKTELGKMNVKVTRLSGGTRYETSVKVAEEIGTEGSVVLATGKNFADALSIAPIAAQMNMPILLTQKDNVPQEVTNYIRDWDADKTFVIGGEAAITSAAVKNLPGKERISGEDRYETNSKIINRFQDNIDPFFTYIATGKGFADALAGSALASRYMSPIILTSPTTPSDFTKETINKYKEDTFTYYILGGETALPQKAIDQLFE
ncbi:cell wall-binding repeat-containing protein [Metabacillus indicus]|uniref:cell wall-binding repeat-containing protein n=1 Tax=Metabacillus indicus TaxID=246786 RepID=UPI0006917587|nr:cell wall-binding repeat-containing protein [Metabacillus indicus]